MSNNNTNSQIASKKLIEHKICPGLLSARDKTQLDKTHMSKILTQCWLVLNIDSLCHFEVGQLKQDAKVKILIRLDKGNFIAIFLIMFFVSYCIFLSMQNP